jgi:hypothetical protein
MVAAQAMAMLIKNVGRYVVPFAQEKSSTTFFLYTPHTHTHDTRIDAHARVAMAESTRTS